jgi:hypothetical protein
VSEHTEEWGYDRRNALVQQSGAGNNWAMGCDAQASSRGLLSMHRRRYGMCTGEFRTIVLDAIRREAEMCDGTHKRTTRAA